MGGHDVTEGEPLVSVVSATLPGPGLTTLAVPLEPGPAVTSAQVPGPGLTLTSASQPGPGLAVLSAQVSGPAGRPGAAAAGALRIAAIGPPPDGTRTTFQLPEAVSAASLHVNGLLQYPHEIEIDNQQLQLRFVGYPIPIEGDVLTLLYTTQEG